MTDWYLIRKFRDDRSEAAFSELVSRYIKLVYSVCYTELQDAQAAEDATQAVFLILARKAEFRRGSTLSSWLFQTARYVASHARDAEARRRRMQNELETMHRDKAQARDMDDSDSLVLTEALGALRDADREALLLRYYQDLSLAEVGDALGVTEDAARKRVARSLDRMRAYLGRHGAANALGVLTAGVAIGFPSEAHAELMIQAATQNLAPAVGLAASTAANQLTLEVLRKMMFTKLKWTMACAIVIAGAGSGTAYVMGQGTGAGPHGGAAISQAAPVPAVKYPQNIRDEQADSKSRMRQLALAVMEYCQDHKERYPSLKNEGQVQKALYSYTKSLDVFVQPSSGKTYQFNRSLSRVSLTAIKDPAAMVLFYESTPRSDGWRYIAYADGHVKLQSSGMWAQQKKASHVR